MTYTLNFRFLLKVAVPTVVALVGIYAMHRWQSSRQVELFRKLADSARKNAEQAEVEHTADSKVIRGRKLDEEIKYRARYLALRPNDVDARERLGRIRFERARRQSDAVAAYRLLEDALRRGPERDELRRYIVDIALDPRLELVDQAKVHLDKLRSDHPNERGLLAQEALRLEMKGDIAGAAKHYKQSLPEESGNVSSYERLAYLLRRVKDPVISKQILSQPEFKKPDAELKDVADTIITDLLQRNPNDYLAHVAAATYYRAFGDESQVRAETEAALSLVKDKPVPVVILLVIDVEREHARALLAQVAGRDVGLGKRLSIVAEACRAWARARGVAVDEKGNPTHPEVARIHGALAGIELDSGNVAAAESILVRGTAELPDSAELWSALCDVRILRNNSEGAKAALASARDAGWPDSLVAYYDARIDTISGKWVEAAAKLNIVRDDASFTAYVRPANLLLARCYEQMGEADRRIEALNRVLTGTDLTDRLSAQATRGQAETQASLGHSDAAIDLYQVLAAVDPSAWLLIAKLRLEQALQQPKANRNFKSVEEALVHAEQRLHPDTTELVLLRADLCYLRGDKTRSRQLIADLHTRRQDDVAVWIALAVQWNRDSNPRKVTSTLDIAQSKFGDVIELRLARATLLDNPEAPEWDEQLKKLAAPADTISSTDRIRLLKTLAEIAIGAKHHALAEQFLIEIGRSADYDIGSKMRRFDVALASDNIPAAEAALAEIARVDQVDGSSYKTARAVFLLNQAQFNPKDVTARDEAERLLKELDQVRPGWSRITLGQAVVADLRYAAAKANALTRPTDAVSVHLDRTVKLYQKAVDQGERQPKVIQHLAERYYEAGLYSEASQALGQLPPEDLESAQINQLATNIALRSSLPEKALQHIPKAEKPGSTDYRDHLWAARAYWLAGAKDKWEAPLRRAVAMAKGDPAPLLMLTELLMADGRKADAEKVVNELATGVATDRQQSVLARCNQLLGKTDEARQLYKRALTDHPNDVRLNQNYADLLISTGNYEEAAAILTHVTKLPATQDEKRQALLWISICRSHDQKQDYSRFQDALRTALAEVRLTDGTGPGDPKAEISPEDLRYVAVLYAGQVDRASKVQALKYLERLQIGLRKSNRVPTATDNLLWAQLHASLNQNAEALDRYGKAIEADAKNPLLWAYYIDFALLQNQMTEDVDRGLQALKALQPDAWRTVELEARLAAARKKPDEARWLIRKLEQRPSANLSRLASLCDQLKLYDDAGDLYRAAAQAKRPEGLLAYAAFLGRRQQTAAALERCDEARSLKNCPLSPVTGIGVAILYAAKDLQKTDIKRVMDWITDGLKTANQPAVVADLMHNQAALHSLRHEYDDAIALYRQVLEIRPNKEVASLTLNNLAFLLAASKGEVTEALANIETAKRLVGPVPELLDTEATVRLKQSPATRESVQAAIALLEDVEVQAPSAVTYFHLALARRALANLEMKNSREYKRGIVKAQEAWEKAHGRGLSKGDLHPLEVRDFEELSGDPDFGNKAGG
jgi:tetratricopeptide (TPR) repeat protein